MFENIKYIYITNDPKSIVCSKLLVINISKWSILVLVLTCQSGSISGTWIYF